MQLNVKETLSRYVPPGGVDHLLDLVSNHRILLSVKKGRVSKLGDFKPGMNGSPHQISVNGDLNPYAFLLVLLHEIAHLLVWKEYGRKVKPHGKEWKRIFGELIREFAGKDVFPPPLEKIILEYSQNVKASGVADVKLTKILRQYDPPEKRTQSCFLEEVPPKSLFVAGNGRVFMKEDKVRIRYRCLCMDNQRRYLFHPMAKVVPSENINKQTQINFK